MRRIRLQTVLMILACLAIFGGWLVLHQRDRPSLAFDLNYATDHEKWEEQRDVAVIVGIVSMFAAMMVGRHRERRAR